MTDSLLNSEAESFAAELSDLISNTVSTDTVFDVIEIEGGPTRIGPGPFELDGRRGFSLIPLRRSCDGDLLARVLLKIEFRVGLDPEAEHLTVLNSTFGLWVRPDPDRRARPVFRLEYDRDAGAKPAAHVHIHAESVELGWVYGTAGLPLPSLQEVHFPVGGRRFRPTVEEVLLFLDRENLFDGWVRPDWRQIVEAHREAYDERQARATVRRNQVAATDELRELGYEVSVPV